MLGRHTGFDSDVFNWMVFRSNAQVLYRWFVFNNIAIFWLLLLNAFDFIFCCQYKDHALKIHRVSNNATIQASVCILNPACSLHFVPSLRFKANLQCAVYILYWPFLFIAFDRQMIPFFSVFSEAAFLSFTLLSLSWFSSRWGFNETIIWNDHNLLLIYVQY